MSRDLQPHASHEMTAWEGSIVTLVSTARFGSIRECRNCGAEHAKTVAGEAMHDELREPCPFADEPVGAPAVDTTDTTKEKA